MQSIMHIFLICHCRNFCFDSWCILTSTNIWIHININLVITLHHYIPPPPIAGPFDVLAHSLATNTTYCLYDSPSSIKICQEKRRRCFLERFPWCQAYFSQTRIPWKEVPRGDKACPKDDQGRECSGVGVCDYDWGMCQCPAGWRGKGCEVRRRQRCTNGPGSRSGASLGIDKVRHGWLNLSIRFFYH